MATTVSARKWSPSNDLVFKQDAADRTTAAVVSDWVEMKGRGGAVAYVFCSLFDTAGFHSDGFQIRVATNSSGADAKTIVNHPASAGDIGATGAYQWEEVTSEQIAQLGAEDGKVYTHIGIQVRTGHANTRVSTAIIRHTPLFAHKDLASRKAS